MERINEGLHLSLYDVGVYLSDSVDGVRSHDAQVRHVHPLASVFLDQRHFPQFVHVFWKGDCDSLSRQIQTDVSKTCSVDKKKICIFVTSKAGVRTSRWAWLIW